MTEPTASHTKYLDRPLSHVIVLAILAVIAYSNTFNVPFVFDDISSITENPVIHNLANYFTNGSGYNDRPNRFIGYLTLALNYHFGGENVVGYHVVNLTIHIGNALLVYALVTLTLRTPFFGYQRLETGDFRPETGDRRPETRDRRPETRNRRPETRDLRPETGDQETETGEQSLDTGAMRISCFKVPGHRSLVSGPLSLVPFLVALLFVVHPIQTQAVTYIVQRLTSLATLFYLAALVLHIRWRLSYAAGVPFASRSVLPFYFLSLVAAVLAMKTKEIAFTLPLIVLLYEFSFFGRPNRRLLALLIPLLLTGAIIPLTMINLSQSVGEIVSDVSSATVAQSTLSRWEYLCTQFRVIATYLRLLVLPINQNLDYSYPVSRTLFEPRVFSSLLLILGILAMGIWLWCKSTVTRNQQSEIGEENEVVQVTGHRSLVPDLRLAAFGILWFFITLSVESSIIPIFDVIFEHRVYLPSVGFFIALVALGSALAAKLSVNIPAAVKFAPPVLIVVALILAGTTFARNAVWANWETLWQDVKRKSPRNPRCYNNLGTYYGNRGQIANAIREFEQAIRIYPKYADAHFNLGRAYVVEKRYGDAAREFRTTLSIDPVYPDAREFLDQLEIVLRTGDR